MVRVAKIALLLLAFMAAAGISTYITVNLLIHAKDTVIVPDLVGKEVVYALEVLTDLELNTKVRGSEFSASIPKNHIISQAPEPGSEIKKGRDVRLVISKGARTVVLPRLVGMTVPQAHIMIEENGLHQGHLSYVYHQERPRDEILSQYPPPGAMGLRGNAVDLLASMGPAPAWMPMINLKAMGLNQAIASLEESHLVLGALKSVNDSALAEGLVIDQTPESGYPVLSGSSIDLVVNRTGAASNTHRSDAVLYRYRAAEGFLRRSVRVRLNRPSSVMDVFNAYIKPGQEIWLLVPKDSPATLFLYVDDELVSTKHYGP